VAGLADHLDAGKARASGAARGARGGSSSTTSALIAAASLRRGLVGLREIEAQAGALAEQQAQALATHSQAHAFARRGRSRVPGADCHRQHQLAAFEPRADAQRAAVLELRRCRA
jgi:hypothetical protein